MKKYYLLRAGKAFEVCIRKARLDGRMLDFIKKFFPEADVKPAEERIVLAAEAGGVLAGFVDFRISGKTAWIRGIAVDKEFEGMGLGGALLESAAEKAFRSGCAKIKLKVSAGNARAISFYEKHGFSRGTEKSGFGKAVLELERGFEA